MDNQQCDYCGTVRGDAGLIECDVCAEGMMGMRCCIANRCIDGCQYTCNMCGAVYAINENEDATKRVLSIDPLSSIPNRRFQCIHCIIALHAVDACRHSWKITHNGQFNCIECHQHIDMYPLNIWHGISMEEWEARYL
jgi:hypothetical protein